MRAGVGVLARVRARACAYAPVRGAPIPRQRLGSSRPGRGRTRREGWNDREEETSVQSRAPSPQAALWSHRLSLTPLPTPLSSPPLPLARAQQRSFGQYSSACVIYYCSTITQLFASRPCRCSDPAKNTKFMKLGSLAINSPFALTPTRSIGTSATLTMAYGKPQIS